MPSQAATDTADTSAVTEAAVLRELARIAFANLLDYVQPSADGGITVDLPRLARDKVASVQEIVVDTTRTGCGETAKTVSRLRVKLGGKHAALVDLGKHLGLFALRRDPGHHVDCSDADLRARAQDIIRALREAGVDLGADQQADSGSSPAAPVPPGAG